MASTKHASSVKQFFQSKLFFIFTAILLVFFGVGFTRSYYQEYKVRQQIALLESEVHSLERKKLESMEVLKYVASDRYVEDKARTELNMKKPGEHILVLDGAKADSQGVVVAHEGGRQRLSNPVKWWYYFCHISFNTNP